jgi:hypothetical protein
MATEVLHGNYVHHQFVDQKIDDIRKPTQFRSPDAAIAFSPELWIALNALKRLVDFIHELIGQSLPNTCVMSLNLG